MNNINQTQKAINLTGSHITLKVVSDDHPLMELAYSLWYEVYIEELKYPLIEGVLHQERKLRLEPNGSLVFLGVKDGECVGTLRTTHSYITPLEFDYSQWLNETYLAEFTRLVIAKKYRKTALAFHLTLAAYQYHEHLLNQMPYTFWVCSAKTNLVKYYKLYGMQKISPLIQMHPILGTKVNFLICSKSRFETTCYDLQQIIDGNPFTKAKWALKYWWYNNAATNW